MEARLALPPTVPAQLRGRRRVPAEFLEFDVPCGGRLAPAGFTMRTPVPCATCGRWDRTLARVVLEAGSAAEGADLLRPANHATVLLASERFAAAVHDAGLTGLAFEPIDGAEGE